MKLLLATTNPGKVKEIGESLAGLSLELLAASDFAKIDPPEETGSTYADNAVLKARHFYTATGLPTIADDSGIVVEALANELGVQTRRWGAGPEATDEEWISFFLDRMAREENRNARFVCTIAYIDGSGMEYLFEGTCDGIITPTLEAGYLPGLPISACFRPHGFDQVYSAMSIDQKNTVSHRGKALRALRDHLSPQR